MSDHVAYRATPLAIIVGILAAAAGMAVAKAEEAREPMDARGQAVALARECEDLLNGVPPPPFPYRKVSELMSSTFSADPLDPDPLRGYPMHCRRTYLYDPDPSFEAMKVPYQFHLVVFNRFDGRILKWYTERLSAWAPLYTTYEGHDLEAGWDSGYGGQVIAALYRLRAPRRPGQSVLLRITPDASDLDLEVAIATPEMPHADEFFKDQFSPHPKTGEHALAWMRAHGLIGSVDGGSAPPEMPGAPAASSVVDRPLDSASAGVVPQTPEPESSQRRFDRLYQELAKAQETLRTLSQRMNQGGIAPETDAERQRTTQQVRELEAALEQARLEVLGQAPTPDDDAGSGQGPAVQPR